MLPNHLHRLSTAFFPYQPPTTDTNLLLDFASHYYYTYDLYLYTDSTFLLYLVPYLYRYRYTAYLPYNTVLYMPTVCLLIIFSYFTRLKFCNSNNKNPNAKISKLPNQYIQQYSHAPFSQPPSKSDHKIYTQVGLPLR